MEEGGLVGPGARWLRRWRDRRKRVRTALLRVSLLRIWLRLSGYGYAPAYSYGYAPAYSYGYAPAYSYGPTYYVRRSYYGYYGRY